MIWDVAFCYLMPATEVSCISCLQGQSWQKIPWIIATILNAQTHLKDSSRHQISQFFLPLPNFFVILKIREDSNVKFVHTVVLKRVLHQFMKEISIQMLISKESQETTCWKSSWWKQAIQGLVYTFSKRVPWNNMLKQFMMETSNSNLKFVTWKTMLH